MNVRKPKNSRNNSNAKKSFKEVSSVANLAKIQAIKEKILSIRNYQKHLDRLEKFDVLTSVLGGILMVIFSFFSSERIASSIESYFGKSTELLSPLLAAFIFLLLISTTSWLYFRRKTVNRILVVEKLRHKEKDLYIQIRNRVNLNILGKSNANLPKSNS